MAFDPEERLHTVKLPPELLQYVVACLHTVRPSAARRDALRAFGAAPLEDAWELAAEPVDWAELEAEAARIGCTVADVVADRCGQP